MHTNLETASVGTGMANLVQQRQLPPRPPQRNSLMRSPYEQQQHQCMWMIVLVLATMQELGTLGIKVHSFNVPVG